MIVSIPAPRTQSLPAPTLTWDEPLERPDRFSEFLRPFETTFRRRDQARWFRVYLQGLLQGGPRKTIEAMVRDLGATLDVPIRDLSQALQNFLNQSPWDEQLLWRQLRRSAVDRLGASPWIGVLEEIGIVKQGQHSVGVHRQYAADNDRKQNCQVAFVLTAVTPEGAFPLACRLYLPRNWATDTNRLAAAGVPEPYRAAGSRGQVALSLLDEVQRDGIRFRTVVSASRHGVPRELREGLHQRGVSYLVSVDDDVAVHPDPGHGFAPYYPRPAAVPIRGVEPLGPWTSVDEGIVRFNGQRVLAADAPDDRDPLWAMVEQIDGVGRKYFLGRFGADFQPSQAGTVLRSRHQSREAMQTMKTRLGLDHFEGRSWRGFHHHASLVALAYWHVFLERSRERFTS